MSNEHSIHTVGLIGIHRAAVEAEHLHANAHRVRRQEALLEIDVSFADNAKVFECGAVEVGEHLVGIHATAVELQDPVALHTVALLAILNLDLVVSGIGIRHKLSDARGELRVGDLPSDIRRAAAGNGGGDHHRGVQVAGVVLGLQTPDLGDELLLPKGHVNTSGIRPNLPQPHGVAVVSVSGHEQTKLGEALPAGQVLMRDNGVQEDLGLEGMDREAIDHLLPLGPISWQLPLATGKRVWFIPQDPVGLAHLVVEPDVPLRVCQIVGGQSTRRGNLPCCGRDQGSPRSCRTAPRSFPCL